MVNYYPAIKCTFLHGSQLAELNLLDSIVKIGQKYLNERQKKHFIHGDRNELSPALATVTLAYDFTDT